jgi:hypothetical protein
VRRAALVYPSNLTSLHAISAELGFATAPAPDDASVTRATKALQ